MTENFSQIFNVTISSHGLQSKHPCNITTNSKLSNCNSRTIEFAAAVTSGDFNPTQTNSKLNFPKLYG